MSEKRVTPEQLDAWEAGTRADEMFSPEKVAQLIEEVRRAWAERDGFIAELLGDRERYTKRVLAERARAELAAVTAERDEAHTCVTAYMNRAMQAATARDTAEADAAAMHSALFGLRSWVSHPQVCNDCDPRKVDGEWEHESDCGVLANVNRANAALKSDAGARLLARLAKLEAFVAAWDSWNAIREEEVSTIVRDAFECVEDARKALREPP